jgi:AP2-like factor (ANT lineage)
MTATQEEAAVAYDVAAIEHRGINAVTNFDIGHYVNWHRRRRRRSLIGEDGLYDDLAETVAAAAAFHDGEQPGDGLVTTGPPVHDAPPSSALDQLLLQSPKFNEIMEQAVSAAAVSEMSNDDNSSPSPCSTSSSSPLQPSPERQSDELSGGAASSSAPCGFPDDAQTCFECDDDGMGFAFAEVDTFLFDDGELPGDDRVTRGPPVHDAPPSSALDLLLLQSSKFKEIMEQAAVTESNNDNSSPSPSPCSTSSSLPSQPSPERQSAEERSGGASASAAAARCGLPDDVQTYFECNDEGMGFAFAEVDTFLFGDLTSYAAPMFQCDMDVFPSWSVECDSNG